MTKITNSKLNLNDKSGNKYTFSIYSIGTSFKAVGGVYIFTNRKKTATGFEHTIIYIGITDNLSTRFNKHHKAECINKHKANCICVMQVDTKKEREEIEKDLLAAHNTPCNEKNN